MAPSTGTATPTIGTTGMANVTTTPTFMGMGMGMGMGTITTAAATNAG